MFQGDAFAICAALLIAISPAMGSFAAVLADRLPRGEDVVKARSRCRQCQHRLGARDLIPLLSFVFCGGRCRHCGAPIPRWLWYMELAALGGTLTLIGLWAPYAGWPKAPALLVVDAGVLWILLALIAADLLWMRLPNLLTGALLGVALLRALLGTSGVSFLPLTTSPQVALIGALIGAGSFAMIRFAYHKLRHREGLGLGDVKLMAGLGALLGPWALPLLVLLAAGSMLLWAVLSGQARNAATPLPFGAALATSAGLLKLWDIGMLTL